VSNDTPFSEALFKTTKYAAGYPDRFTDVAHAEQWCHAFFTHDTTAHRHSSLAYGTPAMVYGGTAPAILTKRHAAVVAAQ
jgi:putative transposase